jgi:8-oxo-dGTP pyrophosphatase MutT (NUDIX family)
MHRQEVLTLLQQHRTRFMDEQAYIARAISYIANHPDCFFRELWPMHVTGSAWVVNPAHDHVLMLHHKKLDQWFQPGGHADGHADILQTALRETQEETGLDAAHVRILGNRIFDVDIHAIPAMHGEPCHEHIDIRFLAEIDDSLLVPGSDESHDVLWVNLYDVTHYNNNLSTYRMVQKTRQLRNITHAARAGHL